MCSSIKVTKSVTRGSILIVTTLVLSSWLSQPTAATTAPNVTKRQQTNEPNLTNFIRSWETLLRDKFPHNLLESIPGMIRAESESAAGSQGVGDVLTNVSEVCLSHTMALQMALQAHEMWAYQMLDAMGRPIPGVLSGNLIWPGAYEQCLEVRATSSLHSTSASPSAEVLFSGQYVTANIYPFTEHIHLGTISYLPFISLGICAPDSCSPSDIQELVRQGIYMMLNTTFPVTVETHPMYKSLDSNAILGIVICSVFLILLVMGTLYDTVSTQMPKWSIKEWTSKKSEVLKYDFIEEADPLLTAKKMQDKTLEVGLRAQILTSFSVYTNGAKLLSTNVPPDSLTCINGIRFLSCSWVILGHTFLLIAESRAACYSLSHVEGEWKLWSAQAVQNATLSVDTFLVLSGLLVAYHSLKDLKKCNGKKNWVVFYVHRIWRVTPVYMLVMMMYVCLSPYWGYGPLWPEIQPDRDNCKKTWWTNLLFVNNLVQTDTMCMTQTWYLALDMQFYLLSPLIVVPLFYSPILGMVISAIFLIVTVVTPAAVTMQNNLSVGALAFVEGNSSFTEYWDEYYVKPYNRMAPYVLGMLTGYFLYHTNFKLRISRVINLCIWTLATAVALAVVYGTYDAYNTRPIPVSLAAFYNAVSRLAWAAAVSWVIIACVTGNGGFVNTLLSWSAFIPLGRLTYCAYLLHFIICNEYFLNSGSLFYISYVNVAMQFVSVLVMSLAAAFVTSLAFESPFIGLERVLLSRLQRKD